MAEDKVGSQEVAFLAPDVFRPTIVEINQKVVPFGPCYYLGMLDPRQDSFNQYLRADEGGKYFSGVDLDPITQPVQAVLLPLFQNEGFLTAMAEKEKEEVSAAEIARFGSVSDERLTERLFNILNHNLDPDLLPFVLKEYCDGKYGNFHFMPRQFKEILETNEEIRRSLTKLMSDPDFSREIYSRKEREPYSTKTLGEINDFINQCLSPTTASLEEVEQFRIKSYLEGYFFDLGGWYVDKFYESVRSLKSAAKRITADVYFDFESGFSLDRSSSFDPKIKETLFRYSRSLEVGRYLLDLFKKVSALYQKFFPEIYLETEIKGLLISEPQSTEKDQVSERGIDEVDGSYERGEIGVKEAEKIKSRRAEGIFQETVSRKGKSFKRGVVDAVTLAHELSHAIYEKIVFAERRRYPHDYEKKADHSLNEGFCVLMELLFADFLKRDPSLLGLEEEDLQSLEAGKRLRLIRLKEEYDGYSEGTFRIFHRVYQQAAGPADSRDVHQGLLAVKKFLQGLNGKKTLALPRDDPKYQSLLKEGNPEKWRAVFSQKSSTAV